MAKRTLEKFIVHESDGTTRNIGLLGRNAWALKALIERGSKGVTPIDTPAPRIAAYIFNLRKHYGLAIETKHEKHSGPFAGEHARYVLHSDVIIAENCEVAA